LPDDGLPRFPERLGATEPLWSGSRLALSLLEPIFLRQRELRTARRLCRVRLRQRGACSRGRLASRIDQDRSDEEH
jgi:hypothetical protein